MLGRYGAHEEYIEDVACNINSVKETRLEKCGGDVKVTRLTMCDIDVK